jgi:hypothetical protein
MIAYFVIINIMHIAITDNQANIMKIRRNAGLASAGSSSLPYRSLQTRASRLCQGSKPPDKIDTKQKSAPKIQAYLRYATAV